MRAILLALGVLAGLATGCRAAESALHTTAHDTASLVSESDGVAPGKPVRIALRLRIVPGWHTYWRNPGDAGAPPTLDLTLPPGVRAGPIGFVAPTRAQDGPIVSYVHTGDVLFLRTLTGATGPLAIRAHATWLVCASTCVPEQGDFALTLPAGDGAPGAEAPLFAAFDQHTPRASPFAAHLAPGGVLWLQGAGLSAAHLRAADFFPADPGPIDQDAPQILGGGGDVVTLKLTPAREYRQGQSLAGVLELTDRGGETASLAIEASPAALPAIASHAAAPVPAAATGLARALLLGFLGGLILNLMPCVLPVLAMKAVAIARLSAADRGEVRREAALYTAGVLTAFLTIGLIVVGAKLGGQRLGWGIQFQSLAFTAGMAWLLFGIGLNLSGVFEIGAGVAGVGTGLAARGSFFTGLLAVVVATPCTAPFMGTALAAAAALPAGPALLIFAALGLGLAAPYALLAVLPGAARWLPRPGAWMRTLREALAFPMYAAALWLVWVASRQTGPTGLVLVLGGGLLLAFAAWAWGRAQSEGGRLGRGVALAALGGVIALGAVLALRPPDAAAQNVAADQRFSAASLAALRAQHRPVFVDLTASWCVTCLVNERVALSPASVRAGFARLHVATLVGDWTRRDPEVTAFLRQYDRDGVPLYVFYPVAGAPVVLPQILTPGVVLGAIGASGA